MRAALNRSLQTLSPLRQHRLTRLLWSALAYTLIALAVALTLLRLAMPWLETQMRPWAAAIFAEQGLAFTADRIALDLHGVQLRLQVDRATLRPSMAEATAIEIPNLVVEIDLLASLLQQQVVTSTLDLRDVELALRLDAHGRPHLAGMLEGDGQRLHGLLGWLAGQPQINLRAALIEVADQQRRSWPLTNVQLQLRSAGYRHQLSGQFSPPFGFAQAIQFSGDWYGKFEQPQSWDGRFWLAGRFLQLPVLQESLAPWLARHFDAPLSGEATFALWSTWSEGRLELGQLQLGLKDFRLPPLANQPAWAAREIEAGMAWHQPEVDTWQFAFSPLRIETEQRVLDPIHAQLQVQLARQADAGIDWQKSLVALAARDIKLADLVHLPTHWQAALPEGAVGWWQQADLRGQVPRLQLRQVADASADATPWQGEVELQGLSFKAVDRWPGLAGLTSTLQWQGAQALLDVQAQELALDWPQHWRKPLALGAVRTQLSLQRDAQGNVLASTDKVLAETADWSVQGQAAIQLAAGSSKPILDLAANFSVHDLAAVADYLPYSRVPAETLTWLQHGLVAGKARNGHMRLHGDVRHFPFEYGGGEFDISMQVEDATLRFDPRWQPLRQMAGPLQFHNAALRFALEQGRLGETGPSEINLAGATLQIDRLNPHGELEIIGQTKASIAAAQAVLRGTEQDIPFLTEELRGEGELALDLRLYKRLDGSRMHSRGRIDLAGVDVHLPNYADLPLQQVRGSLSFVDGDLESDGLEADLLGGPLRLVASTDTQRGGSRLYLAGNTPVEGLHAWLKLGLLEQTAGRLNWSAEVPIQAGGATPENPVVAQSGLVDFALNLPMPLRKPAGEAWPLRVTWARTADADQIVFELKDHMHAQLRLLDAELDAPEQGTRWRGGVHFGPGNPQESELGVRISGNLPNFSVSAWQELWSREEADARAQRFSMLHLPWNQIEAMHLSADSLEIFGQMLRDVDLGANRDVAQWNGTLISDRVAGGFHIPMDADAPYRLNLERAHIRTEISGYRPDEQGVLQPVSERAPTDPRKIPSLQVSCRDLKVDDLSFGEVELMAQHSTHGLLVTKLQLRPEDTTVTGAGAWLYWDEEAFSHFSLDVKSRSLQALVSPFGYQGGIEKAPVTVHSNTRWLGSPADFDWIGMVGDLRMEIGKGRLLDVEPGAGRVFGLLGVHTLPRRLTLDFTDLFKKGLGFDRIVGDFEFKRGHAITDNLILESPAADIRFQGRIGLAEQDYDQIVTVNPKVSESLPVAGAIAAGPAGAAVGGVLMLLQKITEKDGKGIASTQYRMTGSWDDPQMTKLDRVVAPGLGAAPQVEDESRPAGQP